MAACLIRRMSIQNNQAAGSRGEFTTAEVAPAAAQQSDAEFWAMPAPGQTLQGLRRGALYSLISDSEIESVSVRRKGHTRGRRLIVAESLRNYLRRLREEQNPTGKERVK